MLQPRWRPLSAARPRRRAGGIGPIASREVLLGGFYRALCAHIPQRV